MPKTTTSPQPFASVPHPPVNLADLPAFLDAEGVRKHLAPVGRTLLYSLAARGDIKTASLGIGRGKRVYEVASLWLWLQRRMEGTKRPNMAPRRPSVSKPERKATSTGGSESAERK